MIPCARTGLFAPTKETECKKNAFFYLSSLRFMLATTIASDREKKVYFFVIANSLVSSGEFWSRNLI